MELILPVVLLILGLAFIIKGGDAFVESASWLAEKTGIPKFIVGATIVSIATTLPEILVSFIAAAQGKVDMAIGNAIGSVTVNTGLILGIGIIFMPAMIERKKRALPFILMLSSALVLMLFGFSGEIGVVPGIILFGIFIVSMGNNLAVGKSEAKDLSAASATGHKYLKTHKAELRMNIIKFLLGAAGTVIGSRLLVDNGSRLAAVMGVPERIIAVSFVAIGTSLPELVTTLTAIKKKENAMSVGNIIGANIIDLTLILPLSSLIAGQALPVSLQFATVDIPACFAIGCIALVPSLVRGKFSRVQGVLMAVCYLGYLGYTTFFLA